MCIINSNVRVNVSDDGKIILSIGETSIKLDDGQVNQLIDLLMAAKTDAKEFLIASKKIDTIKKRYEESGKATIQMK